MNRYWTWLPPIIALILMALIYLSGTNQAIFLWVNGVHRWTGDDVWANITIFGDALLAMALLFPWIRRRMDIIWATFFAALIATLFIHTLKPFLNLPRPPAIIPEDVIHVIGKAYKRKAFPSGHTATIFTLMSVWILMLRGVWLRTGLFLVALIVGISRMALGVHWATDILGGIAGGWIAGGLGVLIIRQFTWWQKKWNRYVWGVLLSIACIVLIFFYETNYEQTIWLQRIVATICLCWGGYELYRAISIDKDSALERAKS